MEWEQFLKAYPNAHILQTQQWGDLKKNFGWKVAHLIINEWGAQILIRSILPGMKMAYIAKGPLAPNKEIKEWLSGEKKAGADFFKGLDEFCRQRKIFFVKVEPDEEDYPNPPQGFSRSFQTIQPLNTILVDIGEDEEKILQRMKQKTRYNIHLAKRKGVVVEPSDDLATYYQLARQTSERDGFAIHSLNYYQTSHRLFNQLNQSELLLAKFAGTVLAGLIVFAHGNRAWYFYGASSNQYREVMAPYLLQWEAILWAKRKGCQIYDLWGIPDYSEAYLENHFLESENGLWGVYRFKRGFGGRVFRSAGAFDRIYNPQLYRFYRLLFTLRGVQGQV